MQLQRMDVSYAFTSPKLFIVRGRYSLRLKGFIGWFATGAYPVGCLGVFWTPRFMNIPDFR